ncbi:MAG: NADH-quinone oxidoreductase subunit F [Alphaproteobacteria bacterium]|nr:NADH-quinone oxidoreductase subunit F [Alphaproteobacteria bacterium]
MEKEGGPLMDELTPEMKEKLKKLYATQRENLVKMKEEFLVKKDSYIASIYTCNSTGCHSGGAENVIDAFKESLEIYGLQDKVRMVSTGCMGLCAHGPLARVEIKGQKPFLYKAVDGMLARLIVAEHLLPALKALKEGKAENFEVNAFLKQRELSLDLPFFTKQKKVVLKNLGHSDPEDFGEYLATGGYQAFIKALDTMTPKEVRDVIRESGLRGRGGGGFPTAKKWDLLAAATGDEKFVICNGDEGDPGAYMDACILGGGAHSVLEGMMIEAYATGATHGWFYVRAEYPLAIERVEQALKQAKKYGLLGKNILGTDFSFMAELRYGAGAFVCGEETALMESLEGKRGTPHPRPPYPTEKGLFGKPSAINNVETLANVPVIIREGAKFFNSVGTETSKGTKVFALTGKVKHSGLVEVPMGMSVSEIVNDIGGGTSSGKPFKAVQTGGPSGGVIPANKLDMPICYEELKKIGSMMGSGGMIVMDQDDSMVEIAKFYLSFTVDESCGKCAPCRIGGYQMLELMKKIARGDGKEDDIQELIEIGSVMKKASLCALGQTAPNPVLSTLRFFREEYEALLKKDDDEEEGCQAALPKKTDKEESKEKPECATCSGCGR